MPLLLPKQSWCRTVSIPTDAAEKFIPVGIHLLNQGDFPRSSPFFEFFFPFDGITDIKELFIPDKPLDTVTRRKC